MMMMMMMMKISNRRLIFGGEKSRQNLLTRRTFNELSSSSSGNHSSRSREIAKQIFCVLRDRDFYAPLKASLKPLFTTERKQHATQHPYEMFEFFLKNRTKERNERSEKSDA